MKINSCFLVLILTLGAHSAHSKAKLADKETPIATAVFEFSGPNETVQKMSIRLLKPAQAGAHPIAHVKALLQNGMTQSGQVQCLKKKSDEYFCRRDDDGGEFTFQTGKKPKLIFTYFSTAEEDSTVKSAIGSPDGDVLTVEGKN